MRLKGAWKLLSYSNLGRASLLASCNTNRIKELQIIKLV
jgi:hypothetical protein